VNKLIKDFNEKQPDNGANQIPLIPSRPPTPGITKPKTPWVDVPLAPSPTPAKPMSPTAPPAITPAPRPAGSAVPAIPPPVMGLTGSTFSGDETLARYGNLQFRFLSNGQVQMVDADGSVMGTWLQSGNQVTLRFYNGNCVYTGTVEGNRISGTARAGNTPFSWSVSR
jgi:hypothetical protein